MRKTQRQLIVLGLVVLASVGVLVYSFLGGGGAVNVAPFTPPKVEQGFSRAVFENPEYSKLSTPLRLPIQIGPVGNRDPFGGGSASVSASTPNPVK